MTGSGDVPALTTNNAASTHGAPSGEAMRAVRGAFVLGASLVATWTVALVVRLLLPRSLGPALFGEFNFADALAANAFVFITFGLDTYIQKELPARPSHQSEFIGGVFVVRLVASALLFGARGFFGPAAVLRRSCERCSCSG